MPLEGVEVKNIPDEDKGFSIVYEEPILINGSIEKNFYDKKKIKDPIKNAIAKINTSSRIIIYSISLIITIIQVTCFDILPYYVGNAA